MPTFEREPKPDQYEVPAFRGLEIEAGSSIRPPGSWRRLENFEIFRTGAIRKTKGIEEFGAKRIYETPIVAIKTFKATTHGNEQVIGISRGGHVYDLVTGFNFGNLLAESPDETSGADLGTPFLAVMQGKSNEQDVNYLIVVPSNNRHPRVYDPLGAVGPLIGVNAPASPVEITTAEVVTQDILLSTPYALVGTSRQYRYTYWNPILRHESSPSPVEEISIYTPDSFFLGQFGFVYITSFNLFVPDTPTDFGDGYTRKRVYATLDGGAEFFLLTHLDGADDDGSIPLAVTNVKDGSLVPRDENGDPVGSLAAFGSGLWIAPLQYNPDMTGTVVGRGNNVYYGSYTDLNPIHQDPELVEPGPLEGDNDPPPRAAWGGVFQGRLWIVDGDKPNTVRFSKVREFSSFPSDNVFTFPTADNQPITILESEFASFIVGMQRNLSRITGIDFTDFNVSHLDAQVGAKGHRLATSLDGKLYFLGQKGIMSFAMDVPTHEGEYIRPLTDSVLDNIGFYGQAAPDSRRGLVLFSLKIPTQVIATRKKRAADGTIVEIPTEVTDGRVVVILNPMRESPFSILQNLFPADLSSIQETTQAGSEIILVGCEDARVYRLFVGTGDNKATAETNAITTKDVNSWKVFHTLRVFVAEGGEHTLEGFHVSWSVDGSDFTDEVPLDRYTRVGVHGKTIIFRFTHDDTFDTKTPGIESLRLEYVSMDEGR